MKEEFKRLYDAQDIEELKSRIGRLELLFSVQDGITEKRRSLRCMDISDQKYEYVRKELYELLKIYDKYINQLENEVH